MLHDDAFPKTGRCPTIDRSGALEQKEKVSPSTDVAQRPGKRAEDIVTGRRCMADSLSASDGLYDFGANFHKHQLILKPDSILHVRGKRMANKPVQPQVRFHSFNNVETCRESARCAAEFVGGVYCGRRHFSVAE
jgi:hypothetical protein